MKWIRHTEPDFGKRCTALAAASSLFDPGIEDRTREVVEAVRERGDAAVLELTERFDKVRLEAGQLAVSDAELLAASVQVTAVMRAAIREASKNIARFSRRSLRKEWSALNSHGGRVGEKYDAFERVGIYIPGGAAPLVSTALMTVVLAQTAGCPEIVVCTPPGPGGCIAPALLFAARVSGATEIYRMGGAQAIAAMAHGTETVRPVQKIFGPGNAYVVAAKRLLFGRVSIDLLPGPSELLVLADESAEARWVAADLLAQAEHGSGHERVWLISTGHGFLKKVEREVARQVKSLGRRELIERVLASNGWLIQVKDWAQAVRLTNHIAPEHCEIITRNPRTLAAQIRTAGAIFLGGYSPTVLGDYVAGPSHTLPTGGAGRSFAGLTADQFQRRTSVVEYRGPGLRKALPGVSEFAAWEGLTAHGKSAAIRFEKGLKRTGSK